MTILQFQITGDKSRSDEHHQNELKAIKEKILEYGNHLLSSSFFTDTNSFTLYTTRNNEGNKYWDEYE